MDHCLHIACCKYQRPTVMQIDYLVHLKCVMIILYLGLIGIESWIIFNNLLAAFDNEICAMANDCITPFIIIVMWDVFARYGTQMWAIYFVNYLAIHTQLMRTSKRIKYVRFGIHVLSHKIWDPGIPYTDIWFKNDEFISGNKMRMHIQFHELIELFSPIITIIST
eukprot:839536_1